MLEYHQIAGVILFFLFISPIVAGYAYGTIEERTDLLDDTELVDHE